jgi:broad specificity phosphatase PhoE
MTKITLIRHPESEANAQHLIAWRADVSVSYYGKRTAQIFAQYYKWQFDNHIVATWSKQRYKDLVECLVENNDIPVIIYDQRLNERSFWMFTDTTKTELIKQLQKDHKQHEAIWDNFSLWMDQELYDSQWNLLFEYNELLNQQNNMILWEIHQQYPWENILIQTSTGRIRSLLSVILHKTPQEIDIILPNNKVPNLSRTDLFFDEKKQLWWVNDKKVTYIDKELQELFDDLRKSL